MGKCNCDWYGNGDGSKDCPVHGEKKSIGLWTSTEKGGYCTEASTLQGNPLLRICPK